ncbi:MAG TPA: GTPase HflX [Gallionellaceae bacterium]|nr:GTPase HflX [Gallionellaceae bacterium]
MPDQTAVAANNAVLVSLDFGEPDYAETLTELRLLAESAGVSVLALIEGKRQRPDAATFAGSGKVEEIAATAERLDAPLVIFNHDLTPAQMRNLAAKIQARVIDRTMLILDIFALRAKSHEGKVQVELAQLKYLSSRLVGMNINMEQQRHAVGARGPGETQLELDKRKLDRRVQLLNERLRQLKRHREVQRRARDRSDVMSVSIVGYTNAGKSTLFNRLTSAGAYAADQLFATLDTTARKVFLEGNTRRQVVLSDTVGFIRHLPHGLVAAFRSTLEETAQADLLLHVVDAGNAEWRGQVTEVNKVLAEIGAEAIPQILVYNKIDVAGMEPGVERDEYGKIRSVRLSAKTGAGLADLRAALAEARDAEKPQPPIREWHPLNDN